MNEFFTVETDVRTYIRDYRDTARFLALCRQCGNYGRLWSCPPFGFDADSGLSAWHTALIVAARVRMPSGLESLSDGMVVLRSVKTGLEERLLDLEKRYGGLAFGFSGECTLCDECARLSGKECLHPDKVRPALEAYGFNVDKTLRELLGIEMEWGAKGTIPSTITLVGALFHNRPKGQIRFRQGNV
ncbi:MAG: DUF2284 domain-containing protein [Bacteroidales bacterium]|nr:DUF2284 domain-containing protein [Bacteroidales bacterium]